MPEKKSRIDLLIQVILLLTTIVGSITAFINWQAAKSANAKSAGLQDTINSKALGNSGCLNLDGDWRVVGIGTREEVNGTVFRLKQMDGCLVNGHNKENDTHSVQLVVFGNQARGFVTRSDQGDVVGYSISDITPNTFCATAEFAKAAGVANNRQRLAFHKESTSANAARCE